MNTNDLRMTLEQVRAPNIEPGAHMESLEARLLDKLAHPRSTIRHRRSLVAMLVLLVTGMGFATTQFVSRITRTVTWSENTWQQGGNRFLALDQVEPQYRSELADKWERGEGRLLRKVEGKVTRYRVEFTFANGASAEVWAYGPPDPTKRRELKGLIATGAGEMLGSIRDDQSGMVTYLNRYALSDGETVTMMDQFPPMSDPDHEVAKKAIESQIMAGDIAVVGQVDGNTVVEYRLPNGQPFTQVMPTAPAKFTPQREQEIQAMQSAGAGRLIQRFLTPDGWAYLTEYKLSDGTVFRIGQDRPPMPDSEWTNVSREIAAKLADEQYIEETITGTDGRPVPVLTVELNNGTTFQIPKEMRATVLDQYNGR